MIAVWHIMPALRAGCTVINKPASFTPLATLRLIELMNQVLPPGVMNSLAGGGGIGAQLAAHPDVNKVVFTGSIATGQKIMSGAVATLKRLTLELGGNDAGIVLPGTKIDPLLEIAVLGLLHQRRANLLVPQAALRARRSVRGSGQQIRRLCREDSGWRWL